MEAGMIAGQTCTARKECKARAAIALRVGDEGPRFWCWNCWDRDKDGLDLR